MAPRFLCEGLPEGDIIVSEIRDEVPESLICRYFGRKSSKSGWRYDVETTEEEQQTILSLYQRVYGVKEMRNKEITLQFARGLILMSQGRSVNWSQFSAERRKCREGIKMKKEQTVKEKSEREGLESVVAEGNLAKRRCFAPISTPFPSSLKLTPKVESSEGFRMMDKKGKVGGKRADCVSPCWVKDDILCTGSVIEKRSVLIQRCRDSLAIVTSEKEAIEDKFRRAKMLLSDRQVMVDEAQTALAKLNMEESDVRAQIREGSLMATTAKPSEALLAQLDTILFKQSIEERTCRLSREVILECEASIHSMEEELQIGATQEKELGHKVRRLEGLVEGMSGLVRSMSEGGGASFWPRPIADSPDTPIVVAHMLNACPVCCLWYSCFDYVPVACGHTYHPWCLFEHAKVSTSCLVVGCDMTLQGQNGIALGLRSTTKVLGNMREKVTEAITIAKTPLEPVGTAVTVGSNNLSENTPAVVFGSVGDDKKIHVSQSSKTNTSPEVGIDVLVEHAAAPVTCFECNSKPAAVTLQKCGHAFFCFSCIQGKKECPLCFETISGWDPLPGLNKARTQLLTVAGAHKSMPSDQSASVMDAKNARVPRKAPLACDPEAALQTCSNIFDSDSEQGAELRYWCADKEFSEGGIRSVHVSSKKVDASDMVDKVEEPPMATSHFVDIVKFTEKSAPISIEHEVELEVNQVFKRQRRATKTVPEEESLNHTRVLEKPLAELLGSTPTANTERKGSSKDIATTINAVGLNSKGKGTKSQRATQRVGSRQKNIPSRLLDL